MKRYILPAIFSLIVIGVYNVINVNLFTIDLIRRVKDNLFHVRNIPRVDETIVLFNVGKLGPEELENKIDSLLTIQPKKIGINLCHYNRIPTHLIKKYASQKEILFANCDDSGIGSLSQIIDDGNTVTHFNAEKLDRFELQLTDFKGRGNANERINYGPRLDYPVHKGELTSSYFWFDPDYLKDKTILLGYMGDYTTDSLYYFQSSRITPLNQDYGQEHLLPDMYDIEISANILRTINSQDFINELNPFVRVFIILIFITLNVTILAYAKTKWIVANISIATITFIVLNAAASALIVYAFDIRYFLEMDELSLLLLITTVFSVVLNINDGRNTQQKTDDFSVDERRGK